MDAWCSTVPSLVASVTIPARLSCASTDKLQVNFDKWARLAQEVGIRKPVDGKKLHDWRLP